MTTSLLQILAAGLQGGVQGYDQGLEMKRQQEERNRTQALSDADLALKLGDQGGLVAALNRAGVQADPTTYFQKQAEDRNLAATKLQAEQDAKSLDQAKGLLGLYLQNKQYSAANDLAQTNPSIRQTMGMGANEAGPVNLGFAAPAPSPETVLKANTQKQVAQTRALATKSAAATRAAATTTVAATRANHPKSQAMPLTKYRYIPQDDGTVLAINYNDPNDRHIIDPSQFGSTKAAQPVITPAQQAIINSLKPKR